MKLVLLCFSALVLALSILIYKCLEHLPPAELRRRARSGHDGGLYRLGNFGNRSFLVLGIFASISLTVLVVLLNSWWQVLLVSLSAVWLIAGHKTSSNGAIIKFANRLAGALASLMLRLGFKPGQPHRYSATTIYEKEDLLELLNRQTRQPHNRISDTDLTIAATALTFTTKKVSDAMTPLAKTKIVGESDDIGPHLLDELHKAGSDSFVVTKDTAKSAKFQPVGILYLDNALEHGEGGLVKDAMTPGIEYIDEDLGMGQALELFLKRKCHVFIVINNFEECVGVLSLQMALGQIFGKAKPKASGNDKITPDEQSPLQPSSKPSRR